MSWHLVSHKKAIFQVDFLLPFLLAIPNWMQATERNRDQILCAVVAHKICKSRAAWCFSEISFHYTNRSMTSEAAAKLTEKLVTAAQGNTSEWAQHKSDSLSLELSSRVFALFGIALHTHCSDLQVKWHSWWRNQFRVSFFLSQKMSYKLQHDGAGNLFAYWDALPTRVRANQRNETNNQNETFYFPISILFFVSSETTFALVKSFNGSRPISSVNGNLPERAGGMITIKINW